VHEIFYQRIFWLVLGATLAYPGKMAGSLQKSKSQEILTHHQIPFILVAPAGVVSAGLAGTEVGHGTVRQDLAARGRTG